MRNNRSSISLPEAPAEEPMTPRWVWMSVLSVATVVGLPSATMAKGSGISFEKRYHVVGTTTEGRALIEFNSPRAAARALRRQDFWVYMRLPGQGRELLRLGHVELQPRPHPGLDARIVFEVPEGVSGRRVVMVCRARCAHLPDAPHPTSIHIVSGPLEKRMNVAIDRLAAIQGSEKLAPHVRCDCGEIDRRNFYTELWVSSLRQRIIYDARIKDSSRTESIQADLQKVRGRLAAVDRKDGSIVPWPLVGVAVAALAATALRRRRFPNFAR